MGVVMTWCAFPGVMGVVMVWCALPGVMGVVMVRWALPGVYSSCDCSYNGGYVINSLLPSQQWVCRRVVIG